MGLFRSKDVTEKTSKECKKLIEDFFRMEGLKPDDQRVQGHDAAWYAMRGSALVYIFVNEYEDANTVRIASPFLYLPKENLLPFYRACLEINYSLINCAIAIDQDIAYMVSERSLLGLDAEEVQETMRTLATYADTFDNRLSDEFGAKVYSEAA